MEQITKPMGVIEAEQKKFDGEHLAEEMQKAYSNKTVVENDVVNHPSHYTFGNFECLEVMADVYGKDAVENFCICNAFKYIWRAKHKNGIEDIKKAVFYLNKIIELEG